MPDDSGRLFALLDRAEPRLRRSFTQAVLQMRRDSQLPELSRLINAGRYDEALRALEGAVTRFADATNAVLVNAGESTAVFISESLGTVASFNQVNIHAVQAMQENRLRLVREFAEEQRAATRQAISEGITRGVNPREQARAFRSSLGLTQRQQAAVSNYRRLLQEGSAEALGRQLRDRRFDATVARAVSGERPLTSAQIDRMVSRYEQRSIALRAETIARTEALRSVHEGNETMFRQAFDEGTVEPRQVIQEWVIAGDDRVRDSHVFMDGQQRPVAEPFLSGDQNLLRFPGDSAAPASEVISCRCAVTNRITTRSEAEAA